ncbi:MAG: S8 family peptidase [Solirubrobacteraceae bacterium]
MSSGPRIAAVIAAIICAQPAVAGAAAQPNDPLFGQQWPLAHESALGRAAAWQEATGAGALVAVLDTGVDFSHPDLQGAFWTNPDEVPGNRIDDDRNGFVDDVHGADFVNGDGDPADDAGHGTHVAGIVAARSGNGIGGAGLAPNASIMVVKVLDRNRAGTASGLANGIRYAVAHGAQILNTSVNGDGTSRQLVEAIRAAGAAGVLVVASSGNDGRSIDLVPSYPASYAEPAIVAVGANGPSGALSAFSNHGRAGVDLVAPGEDVLSTAAGGGYELRSGTSMAAPHVSATLALLKSARPDLSGAGLKAALLAGARPSALLAGLLGGGLLDAAGALRAALGPAGWRGSAQPLALTALRAARVARGAVLSWRLGGDPSAVARVRVTVGGRVVGTRSVLSPERVRVRARPGLRRWRVTAVDAAGATLAEATGSFRVSRADWPARRRG